MSKKIWTAAAGGLGDVFVTYLHSGHDAGYFKSLKEKYPNSKVKFFISSVNPSSGSFLTHNPHIDEIVFAEFSQDWYERIAASVGDYRRFSCDELAELTWERPELHLDEAETRMVEEIKSLGKYVVLHAFSGGLERSWQGRMDVPRVIDAICDQGYPVVAVGGSSMRLNEYRSIKEHLPYKKDGFHNLLNQQTCRLHAYVTANAWRFIGSASCYSCIAAEYGVPSLLFADRHSQWQLENDQGGVFSMLRAAKTPLHCWTDMPADSIGVIRDYLIQAKLLYR